VRTVTPSIRRAVPVLVYLDVGHPVEDPVEADAASARRDRIPNFVEEALRHESPVKGQFRLSRVPVALVGVDIPAGTTVMTLNGAANRDPRVQRTG
jgi:cytochrome P450